MAFDGACRRQVREAGVVYEVFVRRARCRPCGELETLPPDFVCHGRLDSVSSIGAHLLGHAGVVSDEAAAALLAGVPARTRRSWRQRFADRARLLAGQLSAFCVLFGAAGCLDAPLAEGRVFQAIEATWRATARRFSVPPAFVLANLVLGGELLMGRVDLPHPDFPPRRERGRAP